MKDTSKVVGEYLRFYKKAGVRVANLKSQLETLQAELSIIDAPIAAYSEKCGCGAGTSSPVEIKADKRQYINLQINCIEREITRLETFSTMVCNSLDALDEYDRTIITMYYLDGASMEAVAEAVYMTRKGVACRKKKIVDDLYFMMGGAYDLLAVAQA